MSKLNLRLRCGGCQYLEKKHHALEAPCSELGKVKATPACAYYDPDYSNNRIDPNVLLNIGKLIRSLPDSVQQSIAYAIINGNELARVALRQLEFKLVLGQTVYVNLGAPFADYLNCWYRATVIGVTQHNVGSARGLILFSELDEDSDPVYILKSLTNPDAIMNVTLFKEHRKWLLKKKLLTAPPRHTQGLHPKIAKPGTSWKPMSLAQANPKLLKAETEKVVPETKRKTKTLKTEKGIKVSKSDAGNLVVELG